MFHSSRLSRLLIISPARVGSVPSGIPSCDGSSCTPTSVACLFSFCRDFLLFPCLCGNPWFLPPPPSHRGLPLTRPFHTSPFPVSSTESLGVCPLATPAALFTSPRKGFTRIPHQRPYARCPKRDVPRRALASLQR